MNPDQFNSLAGLDNLQADDQIPNLDNLSSNQLSLSAVDSSGNSTLPMALTAGGSILSAAGDIIGGEESQQADDYNASLALLQGQFSNQQLDLSETSTLSTQKAMYAKAGVEMSGSPLNTALNTASQFEMDKQITTYNAESAANMDTYEGKVAAQQGEFGAAGALLQGAEGIGMLAMLA